MLGEDAGKVRLFMVYIFYIKIHFLLISLYIIVSNDFNIFAIKC